MSRSFPSDASNAFGRPTSMMRPAFNDTAASAFGRQPPRSDPNFTAFSKGPHETPMRNGFDSSAAAAFGKSPRETPMRNGFDSSAAAAFGKKASRRQEESMRSPPVIPKRPNDLGCIMEHFLGPTDTTRDYSNSALRRPKAPEPVAPVETWPELGKPVAAAKPNMNFAEMMKKRVAIDEIEAAEKARIAALQAMEAKEMRLDRGGIFVGRPPARGRAPTRFGYDDNEVIESDLDHVAGDDTAGMPLYDDEEIHGEGSGRDEDEDEEDEYWRR